MSRELVPEGIWRALCAVVGLRVTVSKGGKVLIRDAGFSIQADSFVGILGPSGAGKTTLLNCIASYHQVGVGRIVFDNQHDINESRDEYRTILGHVPQEDVVYLTLTARENLSFAARFGWAGMQERRRCQRSCGACPGARRPDGTRRQTGGRTSAADSANA